MIKFSKLESSVKHDITALPANLKPIELTISKNKNIEFGLKLKINLVYIKYW